MMFACFAHVVGGAAPASLPRSFLAKMKMGGGAC